MAKHDVTIQQTDKSYKMGMLIGFLMLVGGCPVGAALHNVDSSGTMMTIGLIVSFLGGVTWAGSKFFAWWDHG